MYAAVRRSHLTTRLIPLPRYAPRGVKSPYVLKSLGDNDMYAAVRRSHLTTRLIPLPGYAPRGVKSPYVLKSLGENDMYAAVRRSHLTTRLIPLPVYATHGRRTAQSSGDQINSVHSPGKPRILLCSIDCLQLLCCVTIFEIHSSLYAYRYFQLTTMNYTGTYTLSALNNRNSYDYWIWMG